ncbi:hypothetical protein BDE36_1790 [Arcticibacter tournemirensis]|uniref:Uncharacterized protein n=1 Tax=Arcticibacter tournemirensis TaxID=699437 RepID=A0A5M9H9Y1_9SPHI|nr:hypothetical protein [Arcticibacter tournemirensis]KAA8483746.1 hypothetical protein F1649_07610 [Arcticibacter tournemirensis]TQM50055.1 hypothetical protein BDE36_1790 [Arcticibacter tournemirensis]
MITFIDFHAETFDGQKYDGRFAASSEKMRVIREKAMTEAIEVIKVQRRMEGLGDIGIASISIIRVEIIEL